ncbi:L,D-transpeptidase family protein [Vibrio gazogenes]|uniref:L,D-transpeptidase YcfS n=1 Tax=Vibrio gazogenes DSM 21264 = NBRC 103151 TaxID=1123492 RepID=A0A1M4T643_VIBGA|nr:L,D-transpeptidase family protein [Vibrio gazogenes]USP16030.1 L,D-transpeptidase family protein [Vibrio gazogenes]SHE39864.1 L,D-transpeptidase YcfS [Vibrio gazogenes DSM 21264] [Vibrio gazogenes DSM 21264 = NBRC 103151]
MIRKLLLAFVMCCLTLQIQAKTYSLPPQGSRMVGKIIYHEVQKGETVANIADAYNVGFLNMMEANPGVDPFLPQVGHVMTIPARTILPDVPWQGIVVNLAELRLYYFEPKKRLVHIFPVGIGRIGRDTPEMETKISQKRPNPTWTPPHSIRAEYRKKGIELPAVVPAGPDNPLGLFALRLAYGAGDYLIHGTNKDFGIGLRVSSGCIRMNPQDIDWLFHHVDVGEKVRVIDEPVKVSLEPDRSVFVEAHEPLTRSNGSRKSLVLPQALTWWMAEFNHSDQKAKAALISKNGIPIEVIEAQ